VSSPGANSRPTARRRGFALPLVILLALVGGIMVAVMIDRQVAQALTTQRQYESYQFAHATRGVGEAIDAWIRSNQGKPIADALDVDGWAFDLAAQGGGAVKVFLFDGQGLALADLSGLRGEVADSGFEILRALRELHPAEASRLIRREGPLAVSVNAAPPQVLEAVVDSVLVGQGTRDVVAEIAAQRGGTRVIDDEKLARIIGDSTAPAELKSRLSGLLTASPILWRVEAQAFSRATGTRGPRYRAWAVISRVPQRAAAGTADRGSSVQRTVSVFGWERLEDR
jgi:hypothetical protein